MKKVSRKCKIIIDQSNGKVREVIDFMSIWNLDTSIDTLITNLTTIRDNAKREGYMDLFLDIDYPVDGGTPEFQILGTRDENEKETEERTKKEEKFKKNKTKDKEKKAELDKKLYKRLKKKFKDA